MVGVFAALRAGPGCGSVGVSPYLPARLVFGAVVAAAAGPEVLRGGVTLGEPEEVSRSQDRAGRLQGGNVQVPSRAITNSAKWVGGRYRVVP
jgi:hypothetical protein